MVVVVLVAAEVVLGRSPVVPPIEAIISVEPRRGQADVQPNPGALRFEPGVKVPLPPHLGHLGRCSGDCAAVLPLLLSAMLILLLHQQLGRAAAAGPFSLRT